MTKPQYQWSEQIQIPVCPHIHVHTVTCQPSVKYSSSQSSWEKASTYYSMPNSDGIATFSVIFKAEVERLCAHGKGPIFWRQIIFFFILWLTLCSCINRLLRNVSGVWYCVHAACVGCTGVRGGRLTPQLICSTTPRPMLISCRFCWSHIVLLWCLMMRKSAGHMCTKGMNYLWTGLKYSVYNFAHPNKKSNLHYSEFNIEHDLLR